MSTIRTTDSENVDDTTEYVPQHPEWHPAESWFSKKPPEKMNRKALEKELKKNNVPFPRPPKEEDESDQKRYVIECRLKVVTFRAQKKEQTFFFSKIEKIRWKSIEGYVKAKGVEQSAAFVKQFISIKEHIIVLNGSVHIFLSLYTLVWVLVRCS